MVGKSMLRSRVGWGNSSSPIMAIYARCYCDLIDINTNPPFPLEIKTLSVGWSKILIFDKRDK
jgi:hypothetical protein